jgi:hypothetical protein
MAQVADEFKTARGLGAKLEEMRRNPMEQFPGLLQAALTLKGMSCVKNEEIEQLKRMLPELIKNIVWSNFCLYYEGDYLYTFDDEVLTGALSDQRIGTFYFGEPHSGHEWQVEMSGDGESVYLKNVELSQYAHATHKKFPKKVDEDEPFMIEFGPKMDTAAFKWKIEAQDAYYSLFHVTNVENLYSLKRSCGGNRSPVWPVCLSTTFENWKIKKCA